MKETTEHNWISFFKNKLENSNLYLRKQLEKNGNTIFDVYVPKNPADKTEITAGFLQDRLIILRFENPKTKGFTRQQEIEYFYANDFTENNSYGNPGLEFNEINKNAINNQLDYGLKGAEVQFYKNGKLFKSKIYIDEPNEYSTTINFEKKTFWENLRSLFENNKNEFITETRIELKEIFGGIKK
ncbi:hypothetical protein [Chryseobacterium sp.]|uniref:hypothetical protein n=1 Tax=Chryseobacterium sp. TaxID=1871047 RepID=UPI0011C81078|nr:hypothetical protein [Chryseobacterium sp.]TXF76348.1 hypothetical protein FUA25_10720 [Chryseobacterium sp.]